MDPLKPSQMAALNTAQVATAAAAKTEPAAAVAHARTGSAFSPVLNSQTAHRVLMSMKSVALESLSTQKRIEWLVTLTNRNDDTVAPRDPRVQEAIVSLMTSSPEPKVLTKALYQGDPGARLIDHIEPLVTDEALDEKLNRRMGRDLRRARDQWASTYNPADPIFRAQLGAMAASRAILHNTFPFNDGPFTGISATIQNGKIAAKVTGERGDVPLGEPFAIPASNLDVQAEISKRFNEYYYGTGQEPPEFLNALIKNQLTTGPHPAAAIAKAITRVNGDSILSVDTATWAAFIGAKSAAPEVVKKELISQFSRLFAPNEAQDFARRIKIDGQNITMNLVPDAKYIVEARQLNEKARAFFAHDGIEPNFDFVQRVGNKLRFVLPYRLASAFDPYAAKAIRTPEEGLATLQERMVDLELGSASITGPNRSLLMVDIKDAKRLMAASTFSYAGDAQHDIRNVYGAAQLVGLAYLPFDGVADGRFTASPSNVQREREKRAQDGVPVGAQAAKLRRLGFEIEAEIATQLGQALVLRHDQRGLVRVVFRGSDQFNDFVTSTRALQLPFAVAGKNYLAPAGFLKSVESMYPQIRAAVQSATTKLQKIGLVDVKFGADGHSKGGGEAALFALMAQDDIKADVLPKLQQVNLIAPARSISRWDAYDLVGERVVDGLLSSVVGVGLDLLNMSTSTNTATDLYQSTLGNVTSVWAMSRDAVPHLGPYRGGPLGAGRIKPGQVMLFDQATGMVRSGSEGKPTEWFAENDFVGHEREALFRQGISLSSHKMHNVGSTLFNQIGAGILPY